MFAAGRPAPANERLGLGFAVWTEGSKITGSPPRSGKGGSVERRTSWHTRHRRISQTNTPTRGFLVILTEQGARVHAHLVLARRHVPSRVLGSAFTPDGRLAGGSIDVTSLVWDVARIK